MCYTFVPSFLEILQAVQDLQNRQEISHMAFEHQK